jgi:hypothetical protein
MTNRSNFQCLFFIPLLYINFSHLFIVYLIISSVTSTLQRRMLGLLVNKTKERVFDCVCGRYVLLMPFALKHVETQFMY